MSKIFRFIISLNLCIALAYNRNNKISRHNSDVQDSEVIREDCFLIITEDLRSHDNDQSDLDHSLISCFHYSLKIDENEKEMIKAELKGLKIAEVLDNEESISLENNNPEIHSCLVDASTGITSQDLKSKMKNLGYSLSIFSMNNTNINFYQTGKLPTKKTFNLPLFENSSLIFRVDLTLEKGKKKSTARSKIKNVKSSIERSNTKEKPIDFDITSTRISNEIEKQIANTLFERNIETSILEVKHLFDTKIEEKLWLLSKSSKVSKRKTSKNDKKQSKDIHSELVNKNKDNGSDNKERVSSNDEIPKSPITGENEKERSSDNKEKKFKKIESESIPDSENNTIPKIIKIPAEGIFSDDENDELFLSEQDDAKNKIEETEKEINEKKTEEKKPNEEVSKEDSESDKNSKKGENKSSANGRTITILIGLLILLSLLGLVAYFFLSSRRTKINS